MKELNIKNNTLHGFNKFVLVLLLFVGIHLKADAITTISGPSVVNQGDTEVYNMIIVPSGITSTNWTINGGVIVNESLTSVTVNWTIAGTDKYVNGVASTGTNLYLYNAPVEVIAVASTPPTPTVGAAVCDGTTLNRSGSVPSGEIWYWQKSPNGVIEVDSGPSYFALSDDTYYLRAKSSLGWGNASNGVTVNVSEPSVGGNIAKQETSNNTGQLTLSGYTGNTLTWERRIDNGSWESAGSTGAVINYNIPATTSFRVSVKNGVCPAIYSAIMTIDYEPIADQNLNFVHTTNVLEPGVFSESDVANAAPENIRESIAYFDGLGRHRQTVLKKESPGSFDIVQHIAYDPFGRQVKGYLPYTLDPNSGVSGFSNGAFKSNASTDQVTFYNDHFSDTDPTAGKYAFTENEFEASPLNRVLKSYAAGQPWANALDENDLNTGGGDKPVIFNFRSNTIADHVKLWTIGLADTDKPTNTGEYDNSTAINGGALYVTETTDEDGNKVIEFRNKQERVILKKVEKEANVYLWSYYIYDDFGNLRYILPPEAVKAIGNSTTVSDAIRDNYCFYYVYDKRQRMIVKKVPGADEVHLVYDNRDRLVMTQDGNQRDPNAGNGVEWTFTKYDVLNRPVMTGIFKDNTIGNDRLWHQTQVNSISSYAVTGNDEVPDNFRQGTTIETSSYDGQATEYQAEKSITLLPGFEFFATNGSALDLRIVTPFPNAIEGAWVDGYYDKTYPDISEAEILTQTYYDNYDFTSDGTDDYQYNSSYNSQFSSAPVPFANVKGQVTGIKTKIIGTSRYLTSVTFYDDRYRPIQVQSTNIKEGMDIVTTEYDFAGRMLTGYEVHDNPLSNTGQTEIKKTYDYDHVGRLLTVNHSIDGATAKVILTNTYNELGELESKKLHEESTNVYAQSIDYEYNMRGWLTRMNDPSDNDPSSYFKMELKYGNDPNAGHNTYNGNIGTIDWKNPFEESINSYDYDYDRLNRLTKADYAASNDYDVSVVTYDDNGNIKTLTRKGALNSDLDILTYSYKNGNKSNQLLSVNDTGDALEGFKNGANQTTEYTYDANGNMVTDANKGIIDIDYNYLNLPERVDMGNNDRIEYDYDAAGIKLAQRVYENNTLTKTTDYLGGFIYEDNNLQFIQHEEGRVVPNSGSWEYQYHLKDHLGNTRVSFTTEDKVTTFTATMETGEADAIHFYNLDETRVSYSSANHTPNGSKAAMLNLDDPIGPSIAINVVPGDKVSMEAWVYYDDNSGFGTTHTESAMIAFIAGAFGGSSGAGGEAGNIFDGVDDGVTNYVNNGSGGNNTMPSAYLNYIILDENFEAIGGSYDPMTSNAYQSLEKLNIAPITIDKAGWVFVYVSNESNSVKPVYFDDLKVTVNESRILEKSDYYPFGLTFNSYEKAGMLGPKFKFQGQEQIGDLGLNWVSFKWRNHQPDLGRFFNVDPLAEDYVHNSPYAFSENKVVAHIELEGLESVYVFDQPERPQDNGTAGTTYTAEIYVVSEDGTVNGPYAGSSYPNSVSSSDNNAKFNTLSEGGHSYNNKSGHKGMSQKGLNIDDSSNGTRKTTGTSPSGGKVEMKNVNAHSGTSDNGGPKSRGSKGCITCKPSDVIGFMSNFDWSGIVTVGAGDKAKTYTGTTGNSSGKLNVYRGGENAEEAKQNLINKQTRDRNYLPPAFSGEISGSPIPNYDE